MTEDANMVLDMARENMENAIKHLNKELQKLRTGKANPRMLSGITVDYYGAQTPLEQVANLNVPEPRQIVIQPWDKNMIQPIIKEIQQANLGFNPQDDGELIRIIVPELTEERRRDLVKQCKNEGEEARISIRSARKEANNEAKQLKKDGMSEDDEKQLEEEIQKLTDKHVNEVDEIIKKKEEDIMSF